VCWELGEPCRRGLNAVLGDKQPAERCLSTARQWRRGTAVGASSFSLQSLLTFSSVNGESYGRNVCVLPLCYLFYLVSASTCS